MNDRIKKRKGKGSQKRSWTECVDLLQSLAEEQVRNGERALINVGPLQLSAGFAHMKITLEKWLSLSSQQKERKVSLFRQLLLETAYVDQNHLTQVALVPLHSTSCRLRCRMKSKLKKTTIQRVPWWTKQIHRLQVISSWRKQWECLSSLVGNQGPMEGTTNGQDTALCISGVRSSSHAVPLLLIMMMIR